MRFSRAKPTGSFRVFHPSSRRVAAHPDTLRESRINAEFWSKVSGSPVEIQERFPSGEWVTIETVRPSKSTARPKRSHHAHIRTLSPEQLNALRAFANANGRNWKSALNTAWSTGRYRDYSGTDDEGSLQQIRNMFGPSWLTRFSFDNPKTHRVTA